MKGPKENEREISIDLLFAFPILQVQLDLDLEKLTEFAFHVWERDNDGVQKTNVGGWHSKDIIEKHEEFEKLKKEIFHFSQVYHSEIFLEQGMKFKGNAIQFLDNLWLNINKQHHYNDWHIHSESCLSGAYYIKHDGFKNGDILFKHPKSLYMSFAHWPKEIIEKPNAVTSGIVNFTPKSNKLLIFPSWLEHKVEVNLTNDPRISVSFNTIPSLEKKS